MKKFLCFVTSLAMCGMFAVSAHAAEGITADEQKILDAITAGVVVDGVTVTVPEGYVNQATDFLKKNDVTADQTTAILGEIESVKTVMKENKITDVKNIKGAVANDILAHAQAAAKTVGVTLKVGTDGTLTALDANGKEIFTLNKDGSPIKPTGDDYSSMFAMTGAIALLLAGAGVVASKKGYFAK